MSANSDRVPTHLQVTGLTDATMWQRMEMQFSEFRDIVAHMRLETREEATGRIVSPKTKKRPAEWRNTAPHWYDPELGQSVRAWMLIPYIDGVDPERLRNLLNDARQRIPSLEKHFATGVPSIEFLYDWGSFCEAAGAAQLIFFSSTRPGRTRSAIAGGAENLDAHRRWFAHYFLKFYDGRRGGERAKEKVRQLILAILENDEVYVSSFDAKWFERFLNLDGNVQNNPLHEKLTTAFRDLTIPMIKKLASEPVGDLPPLKWDLPPP